VPLDTSILFPPPESWPELRVNYDTKDPSMDTKREIVESDCREGGQWVAKRILCAYDRRVQKDASADGIAGEAEDVEKREVGQEAFRRAALVVEPGLRIEGQRPGCEVQPTAETVEECERVILFRRVVRLLPRDRLKKHYAL
jgi:hypothetical protein